MNDGIQIEMHGIGGVAIQRTIHDSTTQWTEIKVTDHDGHTIVLRLFGALTISWLQTRFPTPSFLKTSGSSQTGSKIIDPPHTPSDEPLDHHKCVHGVALWILCPDCIEQQVL